MSRGSGGGAPICNFFPVSIEASCDGSIVQACRVSGESWRRSVNAGAEDNKRRPNFSRSRAIWKSRRT